MCFTAGLLAWLILVFAQRFFCLSFFSLSFLVRLIDWFAYHLIIIIIILSQLQMHKVNQRTYKDLHKPRENYTGLHYVLGPGWDIKHSIGLLLSVADGDAWLVVWRQTFNFLLSSSFWCHSPCTFGPSCSLHYKSLQVKVSRSLQANIQTNVCILASSVPKYATRDTADRRRRVDTLASQNGCFRHRRCPYVF